MPFDALELTDWCTSLLVRRRTRFVAAVVDVGDHPLTCSLASFPWEGGEALFDLASLTKPFSATLALALDNSGELPLTTRVGEVWPRAGRLAEITLDRLLRHDSGLKRWMPIYEVCADASELADRLLDDQWVDPEQEPTYSDLDYMLWCLSIERALGRCWAELLEVSVLRPLGIDTFAFTPEGGPAALPCELPTGVEVDLARAEGLEIDELPAPERGIAQDGNCRFLARPMGHAGLFATADAVLRLGREWRSPGRVLSPVGVERALAGDGRYALGWYRSNERAVGRVLGPNAFGHDGFTGGTLWVDPSRDLVLVALCHRTSLEVDLSMERADLARRITGTRER